MANAAAPASPPFSWPGLVLSYLVPGLGQIYQGRYAKGILFFVCVYGLFFYGMARGNWSNVYLPDTRDVNPPGNVPMALVDLYNRPQFIGQFWMGAVVWPAIWQYWMYDGDAQTGPLFGDWMRTPYEWRKGGDKPRDVTDPKTRTPPEGWEKTHKTLNEMQTDGDKTWDLAWVYTVIAGVLNVMVIYDAYAGPAFSAAALAQAKEAKDTATAASGS